MKGFLAVEMSEGQMVEDVRMAVNGRKPVRLYGRSGGSIPYLDDIVKAAKQVYAVMELF